MFPATLPAAFSGSNLYKATADSDQTDTDAKAPTRLVLSFVVPYVLTHVLYKHLRTTLVQNIYICVCQKLNFYYRHINKLPKAPF